MLHQIVNQQIFPRKKKPNSLESFKILLKFQKSS